MTAAEATSRAAGPGRPRTRRHCQGRRRRRRRSGGCNIDLEKDGAETPFLESSSANASILEVLGVRPRNQRPKRKGPFRSAFPEGGERERERATTVAAAAARGATKAICVAAAVDSCLNGGSATPPKRGRGGDARAAHFNEGFLVGSLLPSFQSGERENEREEERER